MRSAIVLLSALLWGFPNLQDLPKGAEARLGTSSKEWSQCFVAIASSPDGKTVVTGRRSGEIQLWDLETRRSLRNLLDPAKEKADRLGSSSREVDSVVFSPDGTRIAAVGFGIGVRLWDSSTGELVWKHEEGRGSVSISSDGNTIVAAQGFQGGILVWNPVDNHRVAALEGHKRWVNSVVISPDGKSVYSCSSDLTVRKWDLSSEKEIWRLGAESSENAIGPTFPQHLSLSPDGKRLAITYHGCWQLKAEIVDPETGKVLSTLDVDHSDGLAFMAKESTFALQGKEGRPVLVDARTGKAKARCPVPVSDRIFCVTFTPDGKRLLTTNEDGTLLIWDVSQFEPVRD